MRVLINLCADDLGQSRDFYVSLFDFTVLYDSDWYVQLQAPDNPEFTLGIIEKQHELVPSQYQSSPGGMYMTLVVDDVDAHYQKILAAEVPVLQEPRNEFYGQRRFLITDPAGCLVDVCSPFN